MYVHWHGGDKPPKGMSGLNIYNTSYIKGFVRTKAKTPTGNGALLKENRQTYKEILYVKNNKEYIKKAVK